MDIKDKCDPIKSMLILATTVILLLLFMVVSALFTSKGCEKAISLQTESSKTKTVIIDAGHG